MTKEEGFPHKTRAVTQLFLLHHKSHFLGVFPNLLIGCLHHPFSSEKGQVEAEVLTNKCSKLALTSELNDIMSGKVPQTALGQVRWQQQWLGRWRKVRSQYCRRLC